MKNYVIEIAQSWYSTATIEVEANSLEEALDFAQKNIPDWPNDWDFFEASGEPTITLIDEFGVEEEVEEDE